MRARSLGNAGQLWLLKMAKLVFSHYFFHTNIFKFHVFGKKKKKNGQKRVSVLLWLLWVQWVQSAQCWSGGLNWRTMVY